MTLEALRMVADALGSSSYGVNVQLTKIDTDDADDAPTDLVKIADASRDREVANWEEPYNVPALYVTQESPSVLDPNVSGGRRATSKVSVEVWYIGRDADPHTALADAMYTGRASIMALSNWLLPENQADRCRNGIQVHSAESISWGLVSEPIGDKGATLAIVLELNVHDTKALA